MPDITMCRNENCLIRIKCFRFIAKPAKFQSYALFGVTDISEKSRTIDDCPFFMSIEHRREDELDIAYTQKYVSLHDRN